MFRNLQFMWSRQRRAVWCKGTKGQDPAGSLRERKETRGGHWRPMPHAGKRGQPSAARLHPNCPHPLRDEMKTASEQSRWAGFIWKTKSSCKMTISKLIKMKEIKVLLHLFHDFTISWFQEHKNPNPATPSKIILMKRNNFFWNYIRNLLDYYPIISNLKRRKHLVGRAICLTSPNVFYFNKSEFLWIPSVCQDFSRFKVGLLSNQCKVCISHLGFH